MIFLKNGKEHLDKNCHELASRSKEDHDKTDDIHDFVWIRPLSTHGL